MSIEIEVMGEIDKSLKKLNDEEITRVLTWINQKFGKSIKTLRQETEQIGNELPGIATVTDSGEFKVLIRDLKANSEKEAGLRLALLTIYSYTQLTGESTVSSRKIVTPALKEWRLYTGNVRQVISDHKGIIRDGDKLSLDVHAKKEAEGFLNDVKDEAIVGSWKPGKYSRSTKTKQKSTAKPKKA